MMTFRSAVTLLWIAVFPLVASGADFKALIVDGQNNHGVWPKTTAMMAKYLQDTGRFSVFVARTRFTWQGDKLLKQYAVPGVTTTARPRPQAAYGYLPQQQYGYPGQF